MHAHRSIEPGPSRARLARTAARLLALAVVAAILLPTANAQRRERSGKEVVDAACASCHATGENGAPKIGDENAWKARASQGLTMLTAHALAGIRNMPAHGGNMALSDIEIERAITHMVNRSGGRWVEPLGGATPAVVRSGEQIVNQHCAKCHEAGLEGAPKIGDRPAWTPRLSQGLDRLVKSAVHGHGAMPARGGVSDLTDLEIQGAVVYMFNYGLPQIQAPAAAPAQDPYHKVVAGMDVYLGVVKADSVPEAMRSGVAPRGTGYYHLNISLLDAKTKKAIPDAKVELRVADPVRAETKNLKSIAAYNTTSYGGYFRMLGPEPYTIIARIRRPGATGEAEARFEYRVW
jgi:cytochrome c5